MPPNVFGAGIEELRRLETFVNEVSSYRRAVSELNELSRTMHMDPALVSTGGGGGGERNGERSGGGDGEDSGSGNELDGSEIFRAISEEDITFVTTGGILDLKSIDDKKYRTRYCWVLETLDMFCWTRGTKRNESKYKMIPLSTIHRILRQPPHVGYQPSKENNPYLYYTLESKDKGRKNSMDFKTSHVDDCEMWVQSLRGLLKASIGNRRRVRMAAEETLKIITKSSLPVAFRVEGCGDEDVNGMYQSVQRTKNGARLYMSDTGHVLSREIIDRRAGWILGKDQVRFCCDHFSIFQEKNLFYIIYCLFLTFICLHSFWSLYQCFLFLFLFLFLFPFSLPLPLFSSSSSSSHQKNNNNTTFIYRWHCTEHQKQETLVIN